MIFSWGPWDYVFWPRGTEVDSHCFVVGSAVVCKRGPGPKDLTYHFYFTIKYISHAIFYTFSLASHNLINLQNAGHKKNKILGNNKVFTKAWRVDMEAEILINLLPTKLRARKHVSLCLGARQRNAHEKIENVTLLYGGAEEENWWWNNEFIWRQYCARYRNLFVR